jgi:D-lactate dehydrogenase
MKKIAFFGAHSCDMVLFNTWNESFGFDINHNNERLTRDTVELAKGKDAVCVFVNDELTSDVIDKLVENGVKLIALRCAGFNNVDLKAARDKIRVVRVPAYSPHAVAEYAVTLMLALNRKIYRSTQRTREGNFRLSGLLGFDMFGKTAGIIGMGRIAKELIKILRGFGMNVLAYDKYPDVKFAEENGVKMVELPELYENSDIISLHCPLTLETKHMIDRDAIEMMKPGVMIINTGRGKLIRTEDLVEGLRSRKVGSAGLDVYEEEAKFFYEDHSDRMINDDSLALLLMMPNVIITSHQAFFTEEALKNIANTTLQNIKDCFEGKELVNEVKQE